MKKHQFLAILGATLLFAGCAGNDRIEPNIPDACPNNPNKLAPGICGCDVNDDDSNGNGIMDCIEEKADWCPDNPNKTEPGVCGCDKEDVDTDKDGTLDCMDLCPEDAAKTEPGYCGCGKSDADEDKNNIADCLDENADQCANVPERIPDKKTPGICGCDKDDELDTDGDGTPDCKDMCPDVAGKTQPGKYGCDCNDESDDDGDGVPNCLDGCPDNPSKTSEGICGCEKDDIVENLADDDGDGVINCKDGCPDNPNKTVIGSGCEVNDSDGDGVEDSEDKCPHNPEKTTGDPKKCNYDEENKVFEIWNAWDFKELRDLLNEKYNPKSNAHFLCKYEKDVTYTCLDDTHAVACVLENAHYTWVEIACGSCKEGKCSKIENNEAVKKYDACSFADNSNINRCDTINSYQCKKIDDEIGFVEKVTQCSYNNMGSCINGSCRADDNQQPVQSGNSYGYRCSNYTQSCDTNSKDSLLGSLRTCVDNNIILPQICLESCSLPSEAGGNHSICIQTEPVDSPNLKIRLMKDIDMEDVVSNSNNEATCYGEDWEPINLNQVEFDGGNYAITYHVNKEKCNMVQPLFGSVYNSTIKNVNIKYDFRGKSHSVLANLISRTIVDNVSYSGTVEYDNKHGNIAEGITTPRFGVIASFADRSKFNKINISGKIYYSSGYVASMIGKGNDIVIANSNVKLDKFYCSTTQCSGLVGSDNNSYRTVLDTVLVDIKDFQIIGQGFGISLYSGDMYNVTLNIGNLDVSGNWNSLFGTGGSKELVNVRVNLNNVIAKGNFYAAWNSASPITATNVAIRNDNVFMPSGNYVPISSLTNSVLTDFAIYSNVTLQDTATISTRFAQSSNTNTKLERVVNSTRVFRKESETVTNEITEGPAISGNSLTASKVFYRAEIDGIAASTTPIEGISSFSNTDTGTTVSALNDGSKTKLWVESEFKENSNDVKLPWLKSM